MDNSLTTAARPALEFAEASKEFHGAASSRIVALRPTSFSLARGRSAAIIGRSGSGKSTLLHLAAGIEVPTSGEVLVLGRALGTLSERERTHLRRDHVGLVFQFFHLLPDLSVEENVALPSMIAGDARANESRVRELLDRVGLGDRARDRVDRLSGGERQRVAICRALLRRPTLLLADEPTGNLDDATGRVVMDLITELADEERLTLLVVTHSMEVAARVDERWEMHDGTLTP